MIPVYHLFCPKLINSKGMELHCLVVVRVVWVYLAVLLCNKRKEKRFGAFDHTPFTANYQLKSCTLMWPQARAAPSSCKAVYLVSCSSRCHTTQCSFSEVQLCPPMTQKKGFYGNSFFIFFSLPEWYCRLCC